MNKKIIMLISFVLILCIGGGIFFVNLHLEDNKKNDANINEETQKNDT